MTFNKFLIIFPVVNKNLGFKIAFFLLFIFILGSWIFSLTSPDEGKNAFPVFFMLKTHNFLVPYYNCHPRLEKPPMLYWIACLLSYIFGLNEFSLRLVSGLSAIGIAVFTYLIAKEFIDESTAIKSMLILATLPHFWIEARAFTPEMLLNFFSVGGIYFFIVNRPCLGWIFFAFAVLTKGPVGVILPIAVVVFFKLFKKEIKIFDLKGLVLFFLVASSWYVYMLYKFGYEYFYEFFLVQNIYRFTGKVKIHYYPWYYYLVVIALTSFFYLPAYLKLLNSIRKSKFPELKTKLKDPFVMWFLFVLVFYSTSKGKLHHYIIFSYPALAVILARHCGRTCLKFGILFSSCLLLIGLAYIHSVEKHRFINLSKKWLNRNEPIYFYKTELSAATFYAKKCIPELKKLTPQVKGLIITKPKYEKLFKGCQVLVNAKEFSKKYSLLLCNINSLN